MSASSNVRVNDENRSAQNLQSQKSLKYNSNYFINMKQKYLKGIDQENLTHFK